MRMLNYILRYTYIDSEDEDVLKFGIEMLKTLSLAVLVALAISIALNMFLEAAILLAVLIPLRQNAGGYHTKHRITCGIMSTLIYLCALLLIKECILDYILQCIMCVTDFVVLYLFAPIDNVNHRLDDIEKKVYADRTMKCFLIDIIVFMFLFMFGLKYWSGIVVLAISIECILMIIGFLNNVIKR